MSQVYLPLMSGIERLRFLFGELRFIKSLDPDKTDKKRPSSPRQTFLEEVNGADIYLGIYYKKFSAAAIEEYAVVNDLGIPSIIYVKEVGRGFRDRDLTAFLASIRDKHTYREFDLITELDLVHVDIVSLLTNGLRELHTLRRDVSNMRSARMLRHPKQLSLPLPSTPQF